MMGWLDAKLEERGLERGDLFIWPLGMGVAVLWALPFVWMVSTSLKYPGEVMTRDIEWLPRHITFDNYIKVFEYPVVRWGINSVVQATTRPSACCSAQWPATRWHACALLAVTRCSTSFRLADDPGRGVGHSPAARLHQGWLGQQLPNAHPAVDRQCVQRLHFPPVLPLLPQGLERPVRWTAPPAQPVLPHRAAARRASHRASVIIFTLNWNNFLCRCWSPSTSR